jgi:ADP-ribose pyrophosphatase YjhB (NUDIX family)
MTMNKPENKMLFQYMNTPVRQPKQSVDIKLQEWTQWLMEGDDSPLSGSAPPPSNEPNQPKPPKENEATKQAHALGLESDGYGYWKDPKTGKRVARTLKGKLVKLTSDDPYNEPKKKNIDNKDGKTKKSQLDLGLGMPQAKSKYDKYDKETGGYWKNFFHGDQPYWSGGKKGGDEPDKDKGQTSAFQQYRKTNEPVHTSPNELKWTVDNPLDIKELHGVPFDFWLDAPTDIEGWKTVAGKNPNIQEPIEMQKRYKNDKEGAGVIIIEPDNRVWIVEPMGHYMGYKHTFPKGTVDPGLDLQSTAIKEAYEESGLKVELIDWLGDITRTSSTARYYLARRVGGSPIGHGIETQAVSLVPIEEVSDFMNIGVDKKISRLLLKKLGIIKPVNLPKASDIMAKQIGGQKGTNKGGFYKGTDDKERYVKFYPNPTRAWDEKLANDIYRDLNIGAPKSIIFADDHNNEGYASEIIPGKVDVHGKFNDKLADKLLDGFAADVLVANWDVMGLWNDNILKVVDPKTNDIIPYRIDNGGAFLHRAQGEPKPDNALDTPTEWDFFPSKGQFAQVFKALGIPSADALGPRIVKQIDNIKALENASGGWDGYVDEHAPGLAPKDAARVIQMLNARSQWLYKKADELWAEYQKKNPPETKPYQGGQNTSINTSSTSANTDDDYDLWKQKNARYYKPDEFDNPDKDLPPEEEFPDDDDDLDQWIKKNVPRKKK